MKRWPRLTLLVSARADLFRLGAVAGAAGLLVLLFVLTQPFDLGRHNALLNSFSQLQRDEARLGEGVLQLNFSLSNNDDTVTAIMGHMAATVLELRVGAAASDLRRDPLSRAQLNLLEQQLGVRQQALEQFKSRNAVLKNSLLYLPHARDSLVREVPRAAALHTQLNRLMEHVLLNRLQAHRSTVPI
jgi:hypothetical protein